MTFKHPEVQKHYERVIALKVGGLPDSEQPVFALMDAYGWFRLIDGDQSAQLREISDLLVSDELRPALRSWYQRHRTVDSPVFSELREHLSQLAGERFV